VDVLRAASGGCRGQASISFLATLPLLIAAAAVLAQIAMVGYSLWSAAGAARAGARAELIGAPVGPAARAALPGRLASGSSVERGRGPEGVVVEVRPPRLLPWLPVPAVAGSARLDPEPGDGAGDG
jgi:hypothetical protein